MPSSHSTAARRASRSTRHPARRAAPLSTSLESLPAAIGKYPVLRRLGEGATSEVFLARDTFHQRNVAIKRTRPGLAGDGVDQHFAPHFFAAEASLVGRLAHPNVVQLIDAVKDPAHGSYVVMEYVEGATLRDFCRADRLLPLEKVVDIGFKCAMALDYVWRQGVIHRDIKPANILVTLDANGGVADIKLTDFGSALNLGADRTQIERVGSLAYMSPEQLDSAQIDCRADIYSLGAVLYHLIAGRPPFVGQTSAELIKLIGQEPPQPLSNYRDDVSPALNEVILRALEKSPSARAPTGEAFAQQLSALIENQQVPRASAQKISDAERFGLLRSLAFFNDFTDVNLWEVVRRARWQRWAVGDKVYSTGELGRDFHIIASGELGIWRNGQKVATVGAGATVGEMAYLEPSAKPHRRSADVVITQPGTTISFTPDSLGQFSSSTRHRFDAAFIKVLVRRLESAHETLAHLRHTAAR